MTDKIIFDDEKDEKTNEYKDLSGEKIIELMRKLISRGFVCFVKYTCEKCGERVTCTQPNSFFTNGYTHDETYCGHTSFPDKFGLIVMGRIK